MKKLICLVFALSTFASANLFADWIVPMNQVPRSVINAVKQYFPQTQIWMVEMDDGLYKVKLNNGLEVEVTLYVQIIEIDD
ncbi:PepSY-like domain-containing protein [Brachyspira suanatina]|nr:PepSY-like domain-containing protein [Brachyspira suanatina]